MLIKQIYNNELIMIIDDKTMIFCTDAIHIFPHPKTYFSEMFEKTVDSGISDLLNRVIPM